MESLTVEHVDTARRMARTLARRLKLRMAPEDVVGVANLALVEASRSYDPGRGGAEFSSHAYRRIRGALLDQNYLDQGVYKRGTTRVFPKAPIGLDPARERRLVDQSRGPDDVVALREKLRSLSDRERSVLRRSLVDGALNVEIAAEMGVTASRVGQIIKEALEKVREVRQ